jgi:hypothetical protein
VTSLFIELYLDEDVSILVADLLRGRGFSAFTAHSQGRLGLSDSDQLAYAVALGRALLTPNRADFITADEMRNQVIYV